MLYLLHTGGTDMFDTGVSKDKIWGFLYDPDKLDITVNVYDDDGVPVSQPISHPEVQQALKDNAKNLRTVLKEAIEDFRSHASLKGDGRKFTAVLSDYNRAGHDLDSSEDISVTIRTEAKNVRQLVFAPPTRENSRGGR